MPASHVSEQAQSESLNDIVSRIVLQHNMVEEDRLEEALELQREILDTRGKKQSLERVLLDMGILRGKQLKGLRYAIIYYLVRKADRFYAKIAVQSDICEQKWVDAALREQKRIHVKERRLVRINKILLEKGYINSRENRAILRAIEGIRERRRKKPATRSRKSKAKKAARSEAPSAVEDDLDDLGGNIEALSDHTFDDDLGADDDDPQSIEELEALSGIGDVSDGDLDVDDVSEFGEAEELDTDSAVDDLGDLEDDEPTAADLDLEESGVDLDDDLGVDLDDDDLDLDAEDDDDDLSLDDDDDSLGALDALSGGSADDVGSSVATKSASKSRSRSSATASGSEDLSLDDDDLGLDDDDDVDLDADDDDDDVVGLDDDDDVDLDADDDDDDDDDVDLDADDDDDDDVDLDDDDVDLDADDDDESLVELTPASQAQSEEDGGDDAEAAEAGEPKRGFLARFMGRGKKKAEPARKPRKKIAGKGKDEGKGKGKLGKKTSGKVGKKTSGKVGKKTSGKVSKKTGKKIDTSKLAEMAKKRRSKRFGR
jgi:hypothetical protein